MKPINQSAGSYKLGIFYYNKNDPGVIVKKSTGLGWTLNFANKMSYFIVLLLLFVVAYCVAAAYLMNPGTK